MPIALFSLSVNQKTNVEWPSARDEAILVVRRVGARSRLDGEARVLEYVDGLSHFLLLFSRSPPAVRASSSRVVETIFSGYEKNKMFFAYAWK